MGLAAALRDARWLTAERARTWCRVLAAGSLLIVIGDVALSQIGLHPAGNPIGTDFLNFWAASLLVLQGHAADAYNPAAHLAAQRSVFPVGVSGQYVFVYPPMFLLICAPLALIGFFPALAAWLGVSFAAMLIPLRHIITQRWAILPIVAFPGVLINAGNGQNGFLSAACLGFCAIWLDRSPFIAGLCLGGLVYKPQLLATAPIALLAARRWTAIAGAATSATSLAALSWLLFGSRAWQGFFDLSSFAVASMEQGMVEFAKMQSSFAVARLWGASINQAYAVQAATALTACSILARTAARRPGGVAEVSMMVLATLLCTPYLFSYDLVCLAIPLAWLTAQATTQGWRAWEKLTALAAYALPTIAVNVTELGLPIAALLTLALLIQVARRTTYGW